MVYYFKSTLVDPPAFIYVGKDKVESEYFADKAPMYKILMPCR
jgi:hypothetical protein